MLIRAYAKFSVKHRFIHLLISIGVLISFIVSTIGVLALENYFFGYGFLISLFAIPLLAFSSNYKNKYLNREA